MYKKGFILWCLLLGMMMGKAQISMTLQVPPTGVLVKNQLWNMLLVNSGNTPALVRVSLVLLDEKTNQPVLTASTAPILLNKGARALQAKDLGPIQYNYNSPSFHADQDPNGLLPAGTYQACYSVYNAGKAINPLVENCIQMNVDPLSPPLLNTPPDEGQSYTAYPQFTWLPPTPVGLFNDLSYALVLVEVQPGQGKADAIEMNIPVCNAGFIKNLYMNYPSSYRALDTGKLYAWRIVALNNGQPAAMSDIWTFKVVTPGKPSLRLVGDAFVELKRDQDASIASSGETLKLNYDNVAADSVVGYTITGVDEPGNPVVQQGRIALRSGRNFLRVQLAGSAGFRSRKVYLFKLVNSRNESWSLKFTFSPVTAD